MTHLELRLGVKLDVYGVSGLCLIRSDRVVCQMQFSEKYTDWRLLPLRPKLSQVSRNGAGGSQEVKDSCMKCE